MKVFLKLLKWIPSLIIFSISWYLSGLEHVEHMPSFWNADKLVHMICFAGLTFWVSFACNADKLNKIGLPVLIVSVYGVIDELHQSFTPGRSVSFFDWLADTAGALTGSLVFVLFVYLLLIFLNNIEKKHLI